MNNPRFIYRCTECSHDHNIPASRLMYCENCGHDKFIITIDGSVAQA